MTLSRRDFLRAGSGAAIAAAVGCDGSTDVELPTWLFPAGEDGPFRAPSGTVDAIDPIVHVLNRLTFGARPGEYQRVAALAADPRRAIERFVDEQLDPDAIDDARTERVLRRFEALHVPPGELFEYKPRVLLAQMTSAAVLRAAMSRRQLTEVMVHFWTDHFNIDVSKGDCRWLKAADERLVIRRHALGSFPALLRASATSPAMLWYLDGRVNRAAGSAAGPNENYARELLELHTLGVAGGYSQRDVMEVARALSGWTVRSEELFAKGRVEFRREWHDDGPKDVLGRAIPPGLGRDDLERILSIVALHPMTARHVATKLCRRFIADEPPAGAVAPVAEAFLRSRGDIRSTLRALFTTPEFLASGGTKLKRPFHFVISALRATDARTDAGHALTDYLPRLGHAPYQYPTPDGYPDVAAPWLGTLLWRWNFAAALVEGRIAGTRIDAARLTRAVDGDEGLMAHVLGRRPTPDEQRAYRESGTGLAVMLASPAFQWY